MKILITAGGTSEKIDEVRCITNRSTGAMGAAIAGAFLRLDQDIEIIYVCGETAMPPEASQNIRILRISDVASLEATLHKLLSQEKMDGIIHCMAVSDYTLDTITSAESLELRIADELLRNIDSPAEVSAQLPSLLDRCLHAENEIAASGKISSEMDKLLLVLKKTPKIISLFGALQPKAVLVGFKLLNRVTADALIEAGTQLMKRNGCSFVFANDKTEVTSSQHSGYLIQVDGSFEKITGRAQIAEKIASSVIDQVHRKEA